jgi:hypothetical protein
LPDASVGVDVLRIDKLAGQNGPQEEVFMGLVMFWTNAVALHLIADDGHTPIELMDGTETQAYL